jgi:hypothetical protein
MNKEIEEIAKVIKDNAWKDIKEVEAVVCATELYEQGYRQCKDKVVLTKGAYESISSKAKANVANAIEIRKETAEKIFEEIYMYVSSDYLCGLRNPYKDNNYMGLVKRLAKRFGVEIKE